MKVKKRRSVKTALELIDDDMVVGLGGGETIGYLVEYLDEAQKDVSVVTLSFVREQVCIQAVIAYTADGHTGTIENGDTRGALLY